MWRVFLDPLLPHTVHWAARVVGTFASPWDFQRYPFDSQHVSTAVLLTASTFVPLYC